METQREARKVTLFHFPALSKLETTKEKEGCWTEAGAVIQLWPASTKETTQKMGLQSSHLHRSLGSFGGAPKNQKTRTYALAN